MSGRKARGDGKLMSLPKEARDTIRLWLVEENATYKTVIDRLEKEYGIKTSAGALNNFWQRYCFGDNFARARHIADDLRETLSGAPDLFNSQTVSAISQRAFELAISKEANVKELATLAKIVGDSARLELQKKQLELDLEKWRTAVRTDIEKGLDALYAEIAHSPAAVELFDRLKATVLKSVEVAA